MVNRTLADWLTSARLEPGQQGARSAHFDEFMRWPPPPGSEWRLAAEAVRQALDAFPGNGPVVPVVYIPLTFEDGSRYSATPEWQPPDEIAGRVARDEPPTLAIVPTIWWPAKCKSLAIAGWRNHPSISGTPRQCGTGCAENVNRARKW